MFSPTILQHIISCLVPDNCFIFHTFEDPKSVLYHLIKMSKEQQYKVASEKLLQT